jgi:hypothetical protein
MPAFYLVDPAYPNHTEGSAHWTWTELLEASRKYNKKSANEQNSFKYLKCLQWGLSMRFVFQQLLSRSCMAYVHEWYEDQETPRLWCLCCMNWLLDQMTILTPCNITYLYRLLETGRKHHEEPENEENSFGYLKRLQWRSKFKSPVNRFYLRIAWLMSVIGMKTKNHQDFNDCAVSRRLGLS